MHTIKKGDYIRDPLGGEIRKVEQVEGNALVLTDGRVVGADTVTEHMPRYTPASNVRTLALVMNHNVKPAVGISVRHEPADDYRLWVEGIGQHSRYAHFRTALVRAKQIGALDRRDLEIEMAQAQAWTRRQTMADHSNDPLAARARFDVMAERRRQIEAEGWTPEHDEQWECGELAIAAGTYALHAGLTTEGDRHASDFGRGHPPSPWPWAPEWWKPSSPRRDLVKAAALLLAEIERLDRLQYSEADHG